MRGKSGNFRGIHSSTSSRMTHFRGRFRSFSQSFSVIFGHFWRKTFLLSVFFPFLFLFIPFHSFFVPQPHVFMLYNIKKSFISKFLAFFLAVPNILLTFATVYKMIVIYPAGRPFRLWLRSRRLFLCPRVSFSRQREKGVPIWRLHEP